MKHKPVKQGQTTTPGTPSPTLCHDSADHVRLKTQEAGPTFNTTLLDLLNVPTFVSRLSIHLSPF